MKRILHVVTSMEMGGLESRIMDIYRHIDRNLIQFDFLVHREKRGIFDEEIEALGGKIYRLCPITPKTLIGEYQKQLKNFFIENPEYDIVHSHMNALSMFVLRTARNAGVPNRIAHSRTSSIRFDKKYLVKLYSKLKINKYCTHYFACSDKAGKWLFGKKKFEAGNIKIINNAIEAEKFRFNKDVRGEIRKDLNLEKKFVIGHIGSMRYEKNHSFLIDVFNEITKKNSNAILLLVGDGELRESIENKINKLGLTDKVIFTGIRRDINRIMHALDVFVFPSHFEGFGTVMVEAQAAGLKCFASDNVPSYTKITNLAEYLPVKKNEEYWASEIINKCSNYKRMDTFSEIVNSGFEIKRVALDLQNFYTSKGEIF